MSEEIRVRLEAYFRQQRGDFHVDNVMPITDGWETEVYSFRIVDGNNSDWILRLYPGTGAAEKSTHEFETLNRLYDPRYPAPEAVWHETDEKWLGKAFILMEKVDGRPLGEVMREDISRQQELLVYFVELMVELHQLDVELYFLDPGIEYNPSAWLPNLLSGWRNYTLTNLGQTWVTPILDWLDANKVQPPTKLSALHGDFHPHNVLITPDDQLYVIDWSGFSVGDYRYDLAWTLLLISSSGYPQLRDIILSEYARLAGQPVENIEYFDVLAALRRLVDLAVSVSSGAEAQGMRPEAVAAMRAQQDRYQYVYGLLRDRTGLRVPYLENLIDSLST